MDFANTHGADWKAFEAAVRDRYFDQHATSDYNKSKLANNSKLALRAYGLIGEKDATLTSVGNALYELRGDGPAFHKAFGRHILMNCQGMNFVQCILDMQSAGEEIDLTRLRRWLIERGINVPRGGKHMSTLRLWLEKAGVFVSGYRVDNGCLDELLGVRMQEVEALATFTAEQRAYLKTLANMGGGGPHFSNDIEKLATATYGILFNEKNLPKQVLYRLRDTGYLTLERGTKQAGRGAKPFLVTATSKLTVDVIAPLVEQLEQQTHRDLRPLLRRTITEIRNELDSENRHVRGLALEALAFKLMGLTGLTYVATRLRGSATDGTEVDLVFKGAWPGFSRWQVQCKDTVRLSLDDVAKEVGLTRFLESSKIVMVSTGEIDGKARRYADQVMIDTNICIVMLDSSDIVLVSQNPAAIVDVFTREARHVMNTKRLRLGDPLQIAPVQIGFSSLLA